MKSTVKSNQNLLACPGCNSKKYKICSKKTQGFSIKIKTSVYIQTVYRIKECKVCGLLYRDRTLNSEAFKKYYDEISFKKWENNKLFPNEREILKTLKTLPWGSSILDFGCSSGRLLSALSKNYLKFGFEPNKKASLEARKRGIAVLSFRKKYEQKKRFDFILLVDVFEHLQNPTFVLKSLLKKLKPNGKLLICTGLADHFQCRKNPAEFWYFRNIEHVLMITKKYAKWFSKENNIKIIKWEKCKHYDWKFPDTFYAFLSEWAFWKFRTSSNLMKKIMRLIPFVKKAEKWKLAPGNPFYKDHVILVYKK